MNISEIAKMAGVSSAAVSRYFNNGYVSEEKREAIRKVVEKTGYRPSIQAQTLRTRKTRMIGVILPRIDSSSMSTIMAGILAVMDGGGYRVLLADTQNNPKKELEYLSLFGEKQVDGVILMATIITAAHRRVLRKLKTPVVIVGQKAEDVCCVYHDDFHAMYDMTRRLLEKGAQRLGYIGVEEQDIAVGKERFRGYCEALREKGREECIANYEISPFTIDGGYESAEALWRKTGGVEALLCATDKIAIGAMKYLKETGVRIPDQVMVTGHGDSKMSKVTTPSLTTIHYHYEQCGTVAANMMLERLGGKTEGIREVKMGYQLVENESTKDWKERLLQSVD